MTWQPIETAPDHCAERLFWEPHPLIPEGITYIGNMAEDGSYWSDAGDLLHPTHWQPLPEPPAQGTEAQRAETENTGSVHDGRVPEGNAP